METHTQSKNKNITEDVKGQSEDALQQKCYFWFWNEYPHLRGLLFSVPNGGTRDPREVNKLKLTGLYSGISDLILLNRGRTFFIELKRDEKATQSENQKNWQKLIESEGFTYFIIYSLSDFKILIQNIIE